MTVQEARTILSSEKLQFGDERQIKAAQLLGMVEELSELDQCPLCEDGTEECPECRKGQSCKHCDDKGWRPCSLCGGSYPLEIRPDADESVVADAHYIAKSEGLC